MRTSIDLIVATLLLLGVAYAQPPGNTAIRVKSSAIVGARVVGDTLFIAGDGPVKFPIEYVNRDTNSYSVYNSFVVSSPDGATWGHATGDGGNFKGFSPDVFGIWVDTTGFYPKSAFPGMYNFGCVSCEGAGRDTARFAGLGGLDGDGTKTLAVRPLDSGILFYVIINAKLSDTGKHICIDTSNRFPPSGASKWSAFNYLPAFNTYPTWDGPGCLVLAKSRSCCSGGLTGNVDCDPSDQVDISDLSEYIDSHYLNVRLHCCPAEANMDGSLDGVADISDLTALIDYLYISFTPLAACQ